MSTLQKSRVQTENGVNVVYNSKPSDRLHQSLQRVFIYKETSVSFTFNYSATLEIAFLSVFSLRFTSNQLP